MWGRGWDKKRKVYTAAFRGYLLFVPIYTVGCGEGWVGGHAAPVTVTDLLHVIQMNWVVLK